LLPGFCSRRLLVATLDVQARRDTIQQAEKAVAADA
jgi:hypothetical protein